VYQLDPIDGNDAWLNCVVRMMFPAPFCVIFVRLTRG
jgi:hypothetical protein